MSTLDHPNNRLDRYKPSQKGTAAEQIHLLKENSPQYYARAVSYLGEKFSLREDDFVGHEQFLY